MVLICYFCKSFLLKYMNIRKSIFLVKFIDCACFKAKIIYF